MGIDDWECVAEKVDADKEAFAHAVEVKTLDLVPGNGQADTGADSAKTRSHWFLCEPHHAR